MDDARKTEQVASDNPDAVNSELLEPGFGESGRYAVRARCNDRIAKGETDAKAVSQYQRELNDEIRCRDFAEAVAGAGDADLVCFDSLRVRASRTASFARYQGKGFDMDEQRP